MKKIKKLLSVFLACTAISGAYVSLNKGGSASDYVITAGAEESYGIQCEQMLEMINAYRAENGVEPLKLHIVLCEAANIRAEELIESFSHDRPDGRRCFTVLGEFNLKYSYVGENIAYGYTDVEDVMDGWMNSEGHRANILSEKFEYVGIGICQSDDYWHSIYWTQLFMKSAPVQYDINPVSYGDINGDGIVDMFDYMLLVDRLNNNAVLNELQEESADCNKDWEINVADAVALKKYLLGSSDTLPVSSETASLK